MTVLRPINTGSMTELYRDLGNLTRAAIELRPRSFADAIADVRTNEFPSSQCHAVIFKIKLETSV